MRKLFISTILLLCIFTTGIINADEMPKDRCAMEFINNTNKTFVFYFKQIDHPYLLQTKGEPWTKVVAEIQAKELFLATSKQPPGLYTIACKEPRKVWATAIIKELVITLGISKITATISIINNEQKLVLTYAYNT